MNNLKLTMERNINIIGRRRDRIKKTFYWEYGTIQEEKVIPIDGSIKKNRMKKLL